jgi:hypothetical protein
MSTNQDSHLERMASNEAKNQQEQLPVAEDIAGQYDVVRVRNEAAALGTARCVSLSANNQYFLLLPRQPRRRSAVVLAVDNDVYLCSSQALAQQVAGTTTSSEGFYLPKSIAVPVNNRAPVWVACTTTGSSSRVSVIVNEDDE